MTWEEVSQTAYLLDQSYGSGAEAAYSTRQLRNAATDCMVIRRASDSTTTTIGFDGSGNIDESAIETFCTGTTCTVVTWKDQSGNGNDLTQSTGGNQPTIYTGGALVKDDGKPAVEFDGVNDSLGTTATISAASDYTIYMVLNRTAAGYAFDTSTGRLVLDSPSYLYFDGSARGTAITHSGQALNGFYLLSGGGAYLTENGSVTQSSLSYSQKAISGSTRVFSVNAGDGQFVTGKLQELIVYSVDQSSNRAQIEENIADYFTQNTPLLDTYSGAAAAYSLRLLDSTYTGALVEVYNGSSYADIGANVFGELDTVALAAHCGSNNGFVSVWYDQSGNGFDFSNGTAAERPKIYDGSTGVVTEGNKPALLFSSSGLKNTDSISASASDYTFMAVLNRATIGNDWWFDTSTGRLAISGTSGAYFDGAWQGSALSTGHKLVELYLKSAGSDIYENASLNQSGLSYTQRAISGQNAIGMIYSGGQRYINGNVQEIIIYPTDQSSNRTGIEDDINTFYNIYS